MKCNVLLEEDGRIAGSSFDSRFKDNIEFEFPDDFDFTQQRSYKIAAGELVYDPLPEHEPEPEPSELDAVRKDLLQTQIALAEVFETMIAMMGGM